MTDMYNMEPDQRKGCLLVSYTEDLQDPYLIPNFSPVVSWQYLKQSTNEFIFPNITYL